MIIRSYRETDAVSLLHLFYQTIRTINLGDYTQEQVEAWAPELQTVDELKWKSSFSGKEVFVAEEDGVLAGFGELESDGHIDRFYIHALFNGKGVGKLIYSHLENAARDKKLKRLFVEASITAKPFFEKMGFKEVMKQEVERNGQKLINFKMDKLLK